MKKSLKLDLVYRGQLTNDPVGEEGPQLYQFVTEIKGNRQALLQLVYSCIRAMIAGQTCFFVEMPSKNNLEVKVKVIVDDTD